MNLLRSAFMADASTGAGCDGVDCAELMYVCGRFFLQRDMGWYRLLKTMMLLGGKDEIVTVHRQAHGSSMHAILS